MLPFLLHFQFILEMIFEKEIMLWFPISPTVVQDA